jgi:hypothetical protein
MSVIIGEVTRLLRLVPTDTVQLVRDLLVRLKGSSSSVWAAEFRKFIKGEPCWVKPKMVESSNLEFVSSITLAETTVDFIAKDRFIVDIRSNLPAPINYIADNFSAWFLSGTGKVERPMKGRSIRHDKIRKFTADVSIISELGGDDCVESTLAEVLCLMERGFSSEGLNAEHVNVFYVRDQNGVLRVVHVKFATVGWRIGADSVRNMHRWNGLRHVFYPRIA